MEFIQEIKILENTLSRQEAYFTSLGTTQVLLTALDTIDVVQKDGTLSLAEPYSKAITRYVAAYTDSSYFIKLKDIDLEKEPVLSQYIENNAIKLILDIVGVNSEDDITIKPLNNVNYSIVKELEDAFKEQNITKVSSSTPEPISSQIDIVQIEISREYRDINKPENIEKVCIALENYIKLYTNYS